MQVKTPVTFGHGSSPGRVRETNEDYHRVKTFMTPNGPLTFLAVADGMGGAAAGEFASKIAIEVITKAIQDYADFISQGRAAVPLERALEKSIRAANREIYRTAQENPEREGMGTTITIVILEGKQATIGHVGDSRAYLVRNNKIQQLTKDHSWVAEQVEKGILTPEQAEDHQYKNLLMRVLGTKPTVEPDMQRLSLQNGDVLILASDGLHGLIQEEEMIYELQRGVALQSALEYWIGLANTRGGPDNITGVVAKVNA